jgi:hypothetical protein
MSEMIPASGTGEEIAVTEQICQHRKTIIETRNK